MTKNIIVLGAGMVGSAMAKDLSKKHQVTVADISEKQLARLKTEAPQVETIKLDLSLREAIQKVICDKDIVLSAVPGFMGYNTLKTIIACGKNVVDISFFPENALDLHDLAKDMGVTAIVDCGVAPGVDNLLLGYYNEKMVLTDFECLVGGLPKVKKWPFSYKAPFSPVDVIEEYTREARYVENGHVVVRPAMSETEYVEFDNVGTLESFNTDGLRSIIYTMSHIPNMKEKTLRYPGHIEYVKMLKGAGFFEKTPIVVGNKEVSPIDFTSKVLFNEWKLESNEEEFTVMRVTLRGLDKGVKKEIVYDLYDEYDSNTKTSSMARTTGYTATAAVEMLCEGVFDNIGVFPPELVGKHEACFRFIMKYLAERNIVYHRKEKVLDDIAVFA
ncbi:MAG TPA: saccharopine dehydrogenase [Bacteroidetes bacterium]|nr:saccharopine dehydrogenase [Bacteroidota bacterium]